MSLYVCRNGHLVRTESSQISIDSICKQCKANERRRATKLVNRVAKRKAGLLSGKRA